MQCECILSHDMFCSSRFVSSFWKFLLVISTLLFQSPFIIADIATISCCVPHNKQVCYQLLVQQEWTPALFSLHYLPCHITCLLIYLIYLRFKTISCFFSRSSSMCQYSCLSPHLKQCNLLIGLHLCSSTCFFFSSLKQKSFPLCRPSPLHMPAGHSISSCFELFLILRSSSFLLTYLFIYDSSQSPLHMSTPLFSLSLLSLFLPSQLSTRHRERASLMQC